MLQHVTFCLCGEGGHMWYLNGCDCVSGQDDEEGGDGQDEEEEESAPDLGHHRVVEVLLAKQLNPLGEHVQHLV